MIQIFLVFIAVLSQTTEVNTTCGISFCGACDDNKKCTSCVEDYVLDNGKCVQTNGSL